MSNKFWVRTPRGLETVVASTYTITESALIFRKGSVIVKAFNNYNGWLEVEDAPK